VANRAFFFSQPDIIRYINQHYVPVVGDDWYQRRRQDAEGAFYTALHQQAPHTTPVGYSRQGLYTLTASGKLLSFTNTWQMEPFMEYLHSGVANWNKLAAEERAPGAETIPPFPDDERDMDYIREPPDGGAILKVYTRILETNTVSGGWQHCQAEDEAVWGTQTAIDHVWLTAKEISALDTQETSENFSFPSQIVDRMIRHNLVDNTRGEPTRWELHEIRTAEMTGRDPKMLDDGRTRWSVKGRFLMHTDDNERGFDAELSGYYRLKPNGELADLLMVVFGEHWGDGKYTPHARAGKTPLVISFKQVSGENPADRLPPQGIRKPERYWP
jgi:hypothetical protein